MAYFGTNMVLAQAHWDSSNSGNNNFDLKQSSGFSSVTKVDNCHYRCNFSSTLADDFYVVCGSMSAENAATISNTNVVRGSNGFHVLEHTTSLVEPIFARGRFAGNGTNGNGNLGLHNAICVIKN
tara:strand:+ start:891 stop:1265 length:375 start_codon:yes stop_codon:yes gene_type:complete